MHPLALVALAALAPAQDFSWSGDLAAGRRLSVRNISGDLRVEAAPGRTASVTAVRRAGRHGDPAEVEIRREDTAEGVTFCVVYPGHEGTGCDTRGRRRSGRRDDWDRNDTRVDFTLRVPAGVRLRAATVSGDVLVEGLQAEVEAVTVSGDVSLRDVAASVVEARSVSGSVSLVNVRSDEVGAETVSGDVSFTGEVRPRGNYDLKTLSGDIHMRVPPNTGARITGATFSGRFESSFPIASGEPRRRFGRQRVSGTVGDGSAHIRLESFSGNVALTER